LFWVMFQSKQAGLNITVFYTLWLTAIPPCSF
jgi:hypothetical protein